METLEPNPMGSIAPKGREFALYVWSTFLLVGSAADRTGTGWDVERESCLCMSGGVSPFRCHLGIKYRF